MEYKDKVKNSQYAELITKRLRFLTTLYLTKDKKWNVLRLNGEQVEKFLSRYDLISFLVISVIVSIPYLEKSLLNKPSRVD